MFSTYNLYVFAVIIVCILIFFIKKSYDAHQKEKIVKKLALRYEALALSYSHIDGSGEITGRAKEIIEKIHLIDKEKERNKNKKEGFIDTLKYKLIYTYGHTPIKNTFILYVKSFIVLCVPPYFLNFGIFISIIFGAVTGIYATILLIDHFYNKKISKFLDNFSYALDIIVRGVRTGLPLNICFQKIVEDIDIVVGEQFLAIIDDFRLGMTVDQAMDRFIVRMPLKEVSFFCLSIMIQGKTGGNLAEIVNNLAIVLRKRKSMIIKIQTLSSEAKSSMKIMMCMPIGIVLMLKLVAPEYINVLFEQGKWVLFGGFVWMGIGSLVMRHMINFQK